MRHILLAFLLVTQAIPAMAEDSRLVTLETMNDGRGWQAVGRLDVAGKGFCTAALIRENLVLTAAHCVFDGEGQIAADRFEFQAGLRDGRAEAYRGVKRVVPHPGYDFAASADWNQISRDLALLELDQPIRNSRIRPYDVAPTPASGDQVGIVSYARDRAEAPSLQETCEVLAQEDSLVVMSCDVNYGASGSPVFTMGSGTPQIVSMVSAMSDMDGQKVSVGTSLDAPFAELLTAFSNPGITTAVGNTRLIIPGQRSDIGAKFVRP